jgi:hypothetical protein
MLPVLILATSPRQAEHWQHAIATSALKLRLDPLSGAIACISQQDCAYVNPWRLAWRSLSTNQSCHLADSLRAVPPEVFTSFLNIEEGEEEMQQAGAPSNSSGASRSSGRLTHLVAGNLVHRAATLTSRVLEEREVIALLGLRLTPGHWSIMRLLLAHPLLSNEELAGLLGLERESVRCLLYELHRLDCLESVVTVAGKRWHLCERGLRLIAEANRIPMRSLAVKPDDEVDLEVSTVKQRGESWLFEHIQHTAGIYSFFACVAQAARKEAGHELCWWETGPMCERRYRVGEQWYNLRPDVLAEYRMGQQHMRFWLEWDRGTMNVRDLAIKFTSYAHYIASREWAREDSILPALVCVAPDIAQERRVHRVAQARLMQCTGLEVWTTTEKLLHEHGPQASIWLKHILPLTQALPQIGSHRGCLFGSTSSKQARSIHHE